MLEPLSVSGGGNGAPFASQHARPVVLTSNAAVAREVAALGMAADAAPTGRAAAAGAHAEQVATAVGWALRSDCPQSVRLAALGAVSRLGMRETRAALLQAAAAAGGDDARGAAEAAAAAEATGACVAAGRRGGQHPPRAAAFVPRALSSLVSAPPGAVHAAAAAATAAAAARLQPGGWALRSAAVAGDAQALSVALQRCPTPWPAALRSLQASASAAAAAACADEGILMPEMALAAAGRLLAGCVAGDAAAQAGAAAAAASRGEGATASATLCVILLRAAEVLPLEFTV